MRFSVDAHAIGCHLTGNEVYIRNLLQQFALLDQQHQFTAYISKEEAYRDIPERFEKVRVSENPYRRLAWDLPLHLRQEQPTLLHVQYTAPLFTSVPIVATVHDVSYLEFPEYFTPFRAAQLRLTVKRTVEMAAKVLTPSEFSRKSILKHYAIDPDKVVTVPNAVSGEFQAGDRDAAAASLAAKFGIQAPFVLMVGDLQPRKNHMGLLEAFAKMIAAHPELPHHLVFVGKETWYSDVLHKAAASASIGARVHFTGFVEDEDLLDFYNACDLFVYPSFYEGFGLPILEAMACGRPVACSDSSAMTEVAEGAGLLFDPKRPESIASAMEKVLLDAEYGAKLGRMGLRRSKLFSWERAARLTLDTYYEVAGLATRLEPALVAKSATS
jgi:glycosyltransferase involved in cell wall biosynthesis